ncbi:MAG: hypothetical protein RL094_157 [Candidatus Parcubacteria bacterium]|jgi:16S rRNA (uracil1498-N3)-methyltransferase
MRLHRFFVAEGCIDGQNCVVKDAKLLNQWRNVFRYTTGSRVLLFDGTGAEYLALIASINPDRSELQILEKEMRATEKQGAKGDGSSGQKIYLFLSILKNNNFDLVLQKAAEIGVDVIVPIVSDRVIKKGVNMERSKRILIEASEQSGHVSVPELEEPQNLKDALENFDGKLIVCQSGATPWNKKLISGSKDVSFVIGPEGGWSPNETMLFEKLVENKKCQMVSLGNQTLRAETAAIAVLSLALLQ